MPTLFDPIRLGGLELPNRVIMAPLTRMRADPASRAPTALVAEQYAQRASAGLIFAEATSVEPMGVGYAGTPGIWSDVQVEGWRKVTQAVHRAGGRIVLQLWHVGRISEPAVLDGATPISSSAIACAGFISQINPKRPFPTPRALGLSEIPGVVEAFRRAAENARTAGFDGVEIHGANGYLLDQFLKTGANKREDDYGGSIENRARLLLEVTRAVTSAVGGGCTGIRLSPVTPANDVVDADPQPLFDYVVRELASMNLAYIHIIEGATGGPRELPDRPFDYAALKAAYREAGGKGTTAIW